LELQNYENRLASKSCENRQISSKFERGAHAHTEIHEQHGDAPGNSAPFFLKKEKGNKKAMK
jgi:hypothetical protein